MSADLISGVLILPSAWELRFFSNWNFCAKFHTSTFALWDTSARIVLPKASPLIHTKVYLGTFSGLDLTNFPCSEKHVTGLPLLVLVVKSYHEPLFSHSTSASCWIAVLSQTSLKSRRLVFWLPLVVIFVPSFDCWWNSVNVCIIVYCRAGSVNPDFMLLWRYWDASSILPCST